MPATQSIPSPPAVSTSKIPLFTGLVLFVFAAFVCVTIRRRQTQNRAAVVPLPDPSPPSTAPDRPLHHDVYLSETAEKGGVTAWCSIQPLALQAPFRPPPPREKDGESRWPTIKRPSLQQSHSSRSDASIDTPAFLDDFETLPVDDFDRHLLVAVLIAMPLPPGADGRDSPSRDVAADANMAIGVADTLFPIRTP